MKKRSVIISVLVLVALLVAGGTMAWFTSTPKAVTNTFKAGTVKIDLNVTGDEEFCNVNPGDEFEKEITVTSTGSKQTYVRVKLTPKWHKVIGAHNPAPGSYDIGEDWVKGDDGWYYYKRIMVDSTTTPLIEKIKFIGENMTNMYQNKRFTLEVKAEAVQASNDAYKTVWKLESLPAGVDAWTGSES